MTLINQLLEKGLTLEESNTFKYLTTLIQEGRVTTQVPTIDLTVKDCTVEQYSIELKQLFNDGHVLWATNKGIIRTEDCKNPDTGRELDGYLFISAPYIEKHFDLMYEVYLTGPRKDITVSDKKDFLALITTKILHWKAPAGKESLKESYLDLCEKLYPGEDIINDRIKKHCPDVKKIKIR